MKNHIKLQKYFIILLMLLSNSVLIAQFTRQQAIQKVLNEIVVADTGKINVYAGTVIKSNQDSIVLIFDTTLQCPYTYNWVFFIDDNPIAGWAHPCRYIFMDSLTGAYQIIEQNQYPECFGITGSSEYEVVSQIYS